MPFLSPKRRVSDAENKLRLLLCLRALGMATSDQLWPFVAELELMEYLPYCLLLDELKKDGEVAQGRCALEGVLYLTPKGEKTLSLLRDKLTHTDCRRIREGGARLCRRPGTSGVRPRRRTGGPKRACAARWERCARAMCRRWYWMCGPRRRPLPARWCMAFRTCAPRLLPLLYTLPFEEDGGPLPVLPDEEEALRGSGGGAIRLWCPMGDASMPPAVSLRNGENHLCRAASSCPRARRRRAGPAAACRAAETLAGQVMELLSGEEGADGLLTRRVAAVRRALEGRGPFSRRGRPAVRG